MGNNSRAIVSLVLFVALCAAVLITPGLAHDQPPRSEFPLESPIDAYSSSTSQISPVNLEMLESHVAKLLRT
ncbi:unnamed protein product [Arabis nemorensis]|uniref:Transmembrane protein n=1 Tax=Arabis nemorensis TaxID=586526 RepID=A0A565C9J4_9BRAS|nr:unnamed protein product [Arabis nemorensis]